MNLKTIKQTSLFSLISTLSVLILFFSCSKEDEGSTSSVGINISTTESTLREDDLFTTIELISETEVGVLGSIDVAFTGSAEYGIDYITEPAAEDGILQVVFPPSSSIYSFKIYPVENNDKNANVQVISSLTNARGGVKVGNANQTINTITNVDVIRAVNFDYTGINTSEESVQDNQVILTCYTEREVLTSRSVEIEMDIENATLNEDFIINQVIESNKFTLDFEPNSGDAQIIINVFDNAIEDGDKVINFTMTKATGGVKLGSDRRTYLYIRDDEGPVIIYFRYAAENVWENPEGDSFSLNLSMNGNTPRPGTVKIQVNTEAIYSEDYYTQPEAVSGIIELDIGQGANYTNIDMFIPDDQQKEADQTVTFELIEATGGVKLGESDNTTVITIQDND